MLDRTVDVCRLPSFIAAAEQEDARATAHGIIHSVARPPVDSQSPNALHQRFAVAEVTDSQPGASCGDPRFGLSVSERVRPLLKSVFARCGEVMTNVVGHLYCNL